MFPSLSPYLCSTALPLSFVRAISSFGRCQGLSPLSFRVLIDLPSLSRLSLSGCNEALDSPSLLLIWQNCKRLCDLSLDECSRAVTDEVLREMMGTRREDRAGLRSLSLKDCKQITSASLAYIAESWMCESFSYFSQGLFLRLSPWSGCVSCLATPLLLALSLSFSVGSSLFLSDLFFCLYYLSLISLSLYRTRWVYRLFPHFPHLFITLIDPSLQELNLGGCSHIQSLSFFAFVEEGRAGSSSLTTLDISGISLEPAGRVFTWRLSNLVQSVLLIDSRTACPFPCRATYTPVRPVVAV